MPAADRAVFNWDTVYNDIVVFPTQRANVGTYTFRVKACVPLGPAGTGYEVCSMSDEFDIVIFDPCDTTTITSTIWDYRMTARIAATDTILIDQQILVENRQFPWSYTVPG